MEPEDQLDLAFFTQKIASRLANGLPAYLVDDETWAAAELEAKATYVPLSQKELAEKRRYQKEVEESIKFMNGIQKYGY